ncbi:DUF2066 domain-containing protein, partial [Pseudomonas sp. SAICEU22]|nr:DUF2066 domain-containing protein [Pseudomonas agronomica]
LERYAALGRLLEPFGGQLQRVEGDLSFYKVNGSAEQLKAQLALAKLQEIPAGEAVAPSPAVQPAADGAVAPAQPAPAPAANLRFRW